MRRKKSGGRKSGGKGGSSGLKNLAKGLGKMGKSVASGAKGGAKAPKLGGGMHVGAPKVHHSPRGGTKMVHPPASSHRGADPRGGGAVPHASRSQNPLPSRGSDKKNREKRLSGAAI